MAHAKRGELGAQDRNALGGLTEFRPPDPRYLDLFEAVRKVYGGGRNEPFDMAEALEIGRSLYDHENPRFRILRGPEDWAVLVTLIGRGSPSAETRKKVNAFLESRARSALEDLKKWFGVGRGRPRNVDKRERWAVGAELRGKNPTRYSWRALTRLLDPKGYERDPQRAMNDMRLGIGRLMMKSRS